MSFLRVKSLNYNLITFVIKDISFELEEGKTLALIGKSGSGKTMTLELIAGIRIPQAGRIFLRGQEITNLPIYKRNISIVYQDYALFPHMDVEKNILYSQRKKIDFDFFGRIVEFFKIKKLLHRAPDTLSGGQKQKVAIARALMSKPDLLLLDEPLSSIDFSFRREFLNFIYNLKTEFNLTVIYVTHNFKEALSIADRAVVMYEGKIIRSGKPYEILSDPQNTETAKFLGYRNILPAGLLNKEGLFFSVSPDKISIYNHRKSGCVCLRGRIKSKLDISRRYSIIDVSGYDVFAKKIADEIQPDVFICFKREDVVYLNE